MTHTGMIGKVTIQPHCSHIRGCWYLNGWIDTCREHRYERNLIAVTLPRRFAWCRSVDNVRTTFMDTWPRYHSSDFGSVWSLFSSRPRGSNNWETGEKDRETEGLHVRRDSPRGTPLCFLMTPSLSCLIELVSLHSSWMIYLLLHPQCKFLIEPTLAAGMLILAVGMSIITAPWDFPSLAKLLLLLL